MNQRQDFFDDDTAEMFNAGIEASKFRFIVEHAVAKIIYGFAKRRFYFRNVDEVAVFIELRTLDADFCDIVVCMRKIFCTPVASDQFVVGDKVTGYGNG